MVANVLIYVNAHYLNIRPEVVLRRCQKVMSGVSVPVRRSIEAVRSLFAVLFVLRLKINSAFFYNFAKNKIVTFMFPSQKVQNTAMF